MKTLHTLTYMALSLSMASCSFDVHTVEFVLPDGFRGAFVVIEDPNGIGLTRQNNVLRVDVPESRILKVKSWRLLRDEHHINAKYRSGENLPLSYEPNVTPSTIAFRGGGARGVNDLPEVLTYFVGTEDEKNNFDFHSYIAEIFTKPK